MKSGSTRKRFNRWLVRKAVLKIFSLVVLSVFQIQASALSESNFYSIPLMSSSQTAQDAQGLYPVIIEYHTASSKATKAISDHPSYSTFGGYSVNWVEWTRDGLVLRKTQNQENPKEFVEYNPPLVLLGPEWKSYQTETSYSHFVSHYLDQGKMKHKKGTVISTSCVLGWKSLELLSGQKVNALHWMSEYHFFEGPENKRVYLGSLREEQWVDDENGTPKLLKTKGKIFTNSNQDFVENLYLNLLHHESDNAKEAASWKDQLDRGYSRNETVVDFMFSPEHKLQYGFDDLDDVAFVCHVYRALLQIDPEPQNVDYWVDALNEGMSRRSIVRYFVESQTYRVVNPGIFFEAKDPTLAAKLAIKPSYWDSEVSS